MGAYLSEPKLDKVSSDNENDQISFGASSMQGWRMSQEDAHNSISDFDANTSLFAVYDGHGGVEVATYCAKYLPDLIKTLEEYKNGNIEEALRKGFLEFDAKLITDEAKKELNLLAGNSEPNSDAEGKKSKNGENKDEIGGDSSRAEKEEENNSDDNEDDDQNEVNKLYDEATMPLYEVLKRYTKTKKRVKKQLNANRAKLGLDSVKSEEENNQTDVVAAGSSSSSAVNETTAEASPSKKMKSEEKNEVSSKAIENEEEDDEDENDANFKLEDIQIFKKFALNKIKNLANKKLKAEKEKKEEINENEGEDDDDDEDDNDEEEEGEDRDYEGIDEDDDEEEEEEEDDDDDEEEEEGDEDDFDEEDEIDDDGLLEPQMDGGEPGFDSGCTAVVAIVRDKKLYVANAGDSRCVVCRGGKAIDMSIDHKPEDELERKRIEKAGGKVTSDGRVNGGLNLSRALGDHTYKKNKDLELENQMITSLPDIKVLDLDESDEFMILACDGIWNSMTSQECVDYVRERLSYPKLSLIIEELFMHCLAPNCNGDGTGCDNMTCIIVRFQPHKPNNILTNALTNHSVNSLEINKINDEENDNKKHNNDLLNNNENTKTKHNLKRPLENGSSEESNEQLTNGNTNNETNDNNLSKKIKLNTDNESANLVP